jgi:RHS repeat-associated protein
LGPSSNPQLHNYTYLYDKLNRLTSGSSDESFNETLSYDVMGNISSLTRNPMGTNTYSYTGNQLSSISGALNSSYVYDANGNQTSDSQKGINISYNYLNLPQTINKASTSESMQNTWLSNGAKIRKTVGSLVRDYAGGIEYNNSSIEFIQTEEGRAIPSGSSYSYEYMIKDHLGNTRALLKQDGSILETNDYYPFGLQISRAGQTVPSPENRYKYNGKELQTELGLMQYDYGARFYDPMIARWNVVDALADEPEQIDKSPYTYTWNNPVNLTDPDGNCPSCIIGALIGAGVDYGFQVASNFASGKRGSAAFTENIDVKSIGVSAVAGFASSGLSAIGGKSAQLAINTSIDAGESIAKQISTGSSQGKSISESVSLGQTAMDVVGNKLGEAVVKPLAGEIGVKLEKNLNLSVAERQLDRAQRVGPTSSGRAANIEGLTNKVATTKEIIKGTQKVISGTAQTFTNMVLGVSSTGMSSVQPTPLIVKRDNLRVGN